MWFIDEALVVYERRCNKMYPLYIINWNVMEKRDN